MKKKVFFNGRFLTQQITGVQRAAHELIIALDELIEIGRIPAGDYDFILIYSGIIIAPIKVKNLRILKKGFLTGNLWEQLELPIYTRGHLLISMGYVSSLFKKRQIIIMHDAGTFSHPHFFKTTFRIWYKFAISMLSKLSLHIITVSKFSKKELIKYTKIKEDKVTVIYNAPDHIMRYEEPDSQFKDRINKLQPYLLGVSSLHPHKNFESLSNGITKANLAEFNMVIAGGANVKSFNKVLLDQSVIVLGYVTNEELKYLYSKASLFIFPSLFEGFGIPPLEAMLLGCPVLSSNATALPEVLGNACEYFDPLNEKMLVNKLETLVANQSLLQGMRQKGFERAALYSWHKSAATLYALIKKFA